MKEIMRIRLYKINDVKDFVNAAIAFDEQIDLKSGRYIVDAKSMMGIFSLDLSDDIIVLASSELNESRIKEYFSRWAV